MKKIGSKTVLILLALVLAVSCTQYQILPPWFLPGGDTSKVTEISDIAANVDTERILADAFTLDNDTVGIESIESVSAPSVSSSTVTRNVPVYYHVVVRVSDYDGTEGGKLSGRIVYEFTVSDSTYSYVVLASSITVKASNADSSLTAVIKDFEGTVTGLTITGNNQYTAKDITVSQNDRKGSYESDGRTVTEAGKNTEGDGTSSSPYILMTNEDFVAIDDYGDNVFLALGSDMTSGTTITSDGITLDLNGYSVTTNDTGILVNGGNATILDSRNGEGISAKDAIWVIGNGNVRILNGKYTGETGSSILLGNFSGSAASIQSGSAVIEDGVFYGYDACIAIWGDSNLTIDDGDYSSDFNLVIMTNGSAPLSSYNFNITMNGGTLNAEMIQPARDDGYIAGGFYIANTGTLNLNGGILNIDGGVGVAVRAGTVNVAEGVVINHTNTTSDDGGKVGDAEVSLDIPNDIVVDELSDYPGTDPVVNNNEPDLNIVYITADSSSIQ